MSKPLIALQSANLAADAAEQAANAACLMADCYDDGGRGEPVLREEICDEWIRAQDAWATAAQCWRRAADKIRTLPKTTDSGK